MSNIPVIVGHQDTLLRLYLPEPDRECDFFVRGTTGHLDLPRTQEGGIAGSFFAVFVPQDSALTEHVQPGSTPPVNDCEICLDKRLEFTYAMRITMGMVALLFRLEDQSQGQLKVVRNITDLRNCLQTNTHAAVLHFEGAEAIDPDLNSLEVFYQAGLRSLGPVWSRPNIFAHGVPFRNPASPDTGPGLTDLGKQLLKACNRLGIMIDLSHLNEKGFWDVANLSEAPLVATHSNVHELCQSTRNLTNKQLDAIKESGGLVGLNFGVNDLRADGKRDPNTSLEVLVHHIDHLIKHLGTDGVALGTDFDGTTIPAAIGDVTGVPGFIDFLRSHGYDEATLQKIGYENWLRVLAKTWK